jgi:hypothetical protein
MGDVGGATGTTDRPADRVAVPARLTLLLVPLSSGAAVLVYLLTRVSLPLAAAALAAAGAISTAHVARRLSPEVRQLLRTRVQRGLIAGTAATAAYDAVRYGIAVVGDLSLWPFRPFALFGGLLIGGSAPLAVRYAVGTAYHVLNGLGFAIAYTIFFGRPRLWSALVWACVLELLTILLYPSWLRLQAMGEFVAVSMLGHVAYGLTLGAVAARAARVTR